MLFPQKYAQFCSKKSSKLLNLVRESRSTARTTASRPSTLTEVSAHFQCTKSTNLLTHAVVKSPTEASPVDYVVCAHKAIDQDDVAAQLKPVVEEGRTTFVIIQNGVGNEFAFRNKFPGSSILTCVVCVILISSHYQANKHRPGSEPLRSALG